jgi:hypothetical protein
MEEVFLKVGEKAHESGEKIDIQAAIEAQRSAAARLRSVAATSEVLFIYIYHVQR